MRKGEKEKKRKREREREKERERERERGTSRKLLAVCASVRTKNRTELDE